MSSLQASDVGNPGAQGHPSRRADTLRSTTTLTIQRLRADFPRMRSNVQDVAATVIEGSTKLLQLPIDDLSSTGDVCWWKINFNGTKQLFYECYLLCVQQSKYLELAPTDVQEAIALIKAGDRHMNLEASMTSMAKALAYKKAWDWEANEKFGIENPGNTTPDLTVLEGPIISPHSSFLGDEMVNFLRRMTASGHLHVDDNVSSGNQLAVTDKAGAYTGKTSNIQPGSSMNMQLRSMQKSNKAQTTFQANTNEEGITKDTQHYSDYYEISDAERSSKRKKDVQNETFFISQNAYRATPKTKTTPAFEVTFVEDSPTGNKRGKKFYKWPLERVNTYVNELGVDSSNLPWSALNGPDHELESNCTPSPVDIRYIDFDISIEEILNYFPLHSLSREVACRISKSWPPALVTYFVYWNRDLTDESSFDRSALQHRFRKAAVWAQGPETTIQIDGVSVKKEIPAENQPNTQTPPVKREFSQLSPAHGRMGCDSVPPFDYPIYALAQGIHPNRHPTGKGAQLLTHVIEHILNVSHDHGVKLSSIRDYARHWGIAVPSEHRFGGDIEVEDVESRRRYQRNGSIVDVTQFYIDSFGHCLR